MLKKKFFKQDIPDLGPMSDKISNQHSMDAIHDISTSKKPNIEVYEIDIQVTSLPDELINKTSKFLPLTHSAIIIIAVSIILALLLLCCITLLLMKRWKKKYYNCLQKGDGCDPNCAGSRRPLLRRDKSADSLSRTSNSTRD